MLRRGADFMEFLREKNSAGRARRRAAAGRCKQSLRHERVRTVGPKAPTYGCKRGSGRAMQDRREGVEGRRTRRCEEMLRPWREDYARSSGPSCASGRMRERQRGERTQAGDTAIVWIGANEHGRSDEARRHDGRGAKFVPVALQKSPADCLMVIQQAIRWRYLPVRSRAGLLR